MIIKEHNVLVSSKFWVIDLDFSEDYIKTLEIAAKKVEQTQAYKTNVQADMSSWRIWEQSKVFNPALSRIDDCCQYVCPNQLRLTKEGEHPKLKTYEAWTAVYRKNDYTKRHSHSSSLISWVYYIKADPEKDQPLSIDCVAASGGSLEVDAITNRLIIFPGQLMHSVSYQTEDTERIVMAGNTNWNDS